MASGFMVCVGTRRAALGKLSKSSPGFSDCSIST